MRVAGGVCLHGERAAGRSTGKLLDDSKTYLCCQVPINETECYGVAFDERQIVIYRYKNDDSKSKVVQVIAL